MDWSKIRLKDIYGINRINDAESLTEQFPPVQFMFSARDYFDDHDLLSEQAPFEKINLPFDGDVSVREVAPDYFEHFNTLQNCFVTAMPIQISQRKLMYKFRTLLAKRSRL